MKKRLVHITEEIIFDEIIKRVQVNDALKKLKAKWENLDFSMNLYFNQDKKFRAKIEFIRAYKPQ